MGRAKNLAGASEDYKAYLSLAPESPQKDKIETLIGLLDGAVGEAQATQLAQETRKKKEEDAKQAAAAEAAAEQQKVDAAAEVQRQAEAAAAQEEKQKQEEILAKIRDSLARASDDSQALSIGPSGVKSDAGDFTVEP